MKETPVCVGENCTAAAFQKCTRQACLSCCRLFGKNIGCEVHEEKQNKRKETREIKKQNYRERKKARIGK